MGVSTQKLIRFRRLCWRIGSNLFWFDKTNSHNHIDCATYDESGKDGLGVSYENAWQYDAAGNRSVTTYKRATVEAPNTVATTTTIAAVFSGNDWLTSQTSTVKTAAATNATTTVYGYDQNGAQTHKRVGAAGAVEVNDWQFDGTLASTETQGVATGGSAFVYDAGGNRLKQRTQIGKPDAKEVRYLVDPNTSYAQVVQERDENNVLHARYAWEDGVAPLVMWRRTKAGAYAAFFYLCDGQDSVRQLSDAAGRVTDSYFYDAFGNALQGGSGDTPNPFRYTGQQLDPSGNYYLRARYYNSGNGRFLSHDPLMGNSSDPISMHRYLYASADGVNGSDPSGEDTLISISTSLSFWTVLGRGAVGAVIGGAVGGADAYLAGGDVMEGAATGAAFGFGLGVIGGPGVATPLLRAILLGVGITGGVSGTGLAIADENYKLAAFRTILTIAPLAARAKAMRNFENQEEMLRLTTEAATKAPENPIKLSVGQSMAVKAENLRVHARNSVERSRLQPIRESLRNGEYIREPLQVTEEGIIVAGHHRAFAAAERGYSVDVKIVADPGYGTYQQGTPIGSLKVTN